MFNRITRAATLGVFILTLASCAEAPKEEAAPPVEAPKPVEPAGPFYELTKDEITSHPDWTSQNVTLKGAKIGDKTKDVEKSFGELVATEPLGDHYRSIYEKVSYAIYTHKMTGELQKIEIFAKYADQIADPKLKKLLSGGKEDYMREIFGPEEGVDINPITTGSEHLYDAKGVRFAKYDLNGNKFHSLIFSKMKKK